MHFVVKKNRMRLHWLQHVPFEGLGFIEEWATSREMQITGTHLYAGEKPPSSMDFDWLVIMGGPMGIQDHGEHPWLVEEKVFIRAAIDAGKPVVGICLGAQLIADVLGAKVYPGPCKEIGWFPLRRAPEAPAWFPEELTAFHWHGDTFDLPENSIRLASSDACRNQGFIYRDRVVGLQFHLESTPESIRRLVENCRDDLVPGPFVQGKSLLCRPEPCSAVHPVLADVLDYLFGGTS